MTIISVIFLSIQAEHRILLTGTPLQNNLIELMSLLIFVMPHMFEGKKDILKSLFSKCPVSRQNLLSWVGSDDKTLSFLVWPSMGISLVSFSTLSLILFMYFLLLGLPSGCLFLLPCLVFSKELDDFDTKYSLPEHGRTVMMV